MSDGTLLQIRSLFTDHIYSHAQIFKCIGNIFPMIESFNVFPKLICTDASYFLVCVDSDGQIEVTTACILASENADRMINFRNTTLTCSDS